MDKLLNPCGEFRKDSSTPTVKELQNEELYQGTVTQNRIPNVDGYDGDDSLICCRYGEAKRERS